MLFVRWNDSLVVHKTKKRRHIPTYRLLYLSSTLSVISFSVLCMHVFLRNLFLSLLAHDEQKAGLPDVGDRLFYFRKGHEQSMISMQQVSEGLDFYSFHLFGVLKCR